MTRNVALMIVTNDACFNRYSALNRWDEKAGLHGMRYAPSVSTCSRHKKVGVGIMITHHPLHGSGQAALPHPALALGQDAQAT